MLTMFGKALFGLFKSNGGKIRKAWITVLPTAFAVVFALPAVAQASVTGPFTFGSFTDVCAAYHGFEGNPAWRGLQRDAVRGPVHLNVQPVAGQRERQSNGRQSRDELCGNRFWSGQYRISLDSSADPQRTGQPAL